MMDDMTATLRESMLRAAKALDEADALLVTAGAGMGVDSGLPDFRGDKGFWKAYPVLAKLGKSFVEMAAPEWFHRDPPLAWAFYGHRLNLYRATEPHAGFTRLVELGKRKKGGCFVFTSNVDGQFQKAGFDEDRIEECHGSIHHFQCAEPCGADIWDASDMEVRVDEDSFKGLEPLPRCEKCGGIARPNILMFGDWSWNDDRTRIQGANLSNWMRGVTAGGMRLAVMEIGAGEAVATVRRFSEHAAQRCGATLVRINPRDYRVPNAAHVSIPLGAAEGIGGIFDLMERGHSI